MNRRAHSLGARLLTLVVSLITCTAVETRAGASAPLKIRVLQDGSCEVGTKRLACSGIPDYMREVLKLDRGVQCSVDARDAPTYESVRVLAEALQRAGCKVGFVNVSK